MTFIPTNAPVPALFDRRVVDDERGFGLVESVVSVGVAGAGLLAVAGLLATGAGLQQRSRDGGRAGMAATQVLEQLRVLPRIDPRVQIRPGTAPNSLASNQANYNTLVNVAPAGRVRVRWTVNAGPANSIEIVVHGLPEIEGARPSEVRSLVWRPAVS